MGTRGRAVVHQHLRHALSNKIRDDVREALLSGDGSAIPADLAAEYIVATFMLVLHWWVESRSPLSAREVDDLFIALVVPAITTSLGHANG
jgi:glycerol uptake facilitator-like aquaporin